jgi:tripartite-type tricarboxylate transporter receptor subunit TctC
MADCVPGYDANGFAGIGVPKNTPPEIIDRLNKEINAGLAAPKIKTRIVELGGTVVGPQARLRSDENDNGPNT